MSQRGGFGQKSNSRVNLTVNDRPNSSSGVKGEVSRRSLYTRKNPVPLREGSASLHFLALARDEAHRAANELRKKLGKRRHLRSGLDDIPGIGAKTRTRLLRTLGSLRGVSQATEDELVDAGATRKQANAIRSAFPRLPGTG